MNLELVDVVLFSTYFFLLFMSIFWLLVLFSSEEKGQQKKKLTEFPVVSVLIPAYNEEESIIETISSVCHLDYPAEKLEVIVINDGSADRTKEKVEQFIHIHPQHKIILLNQENTGKGKAMNQGLEKTSGDFFASLDADSFVSPNALQEMLPYFEDTQVAAVCPLLKVRKPSSIIQKVQWYEYVINMFYRWLNAKVNCIHVTPGPFSVYRTAVIKKLGGYDEKNITEDLEIAIRLQKHHYKILHTYDATVETLSPQTWRALFRQRVRWYKGSIDNALRYKKLLFNREYGDFGYMRMPTILLSGVLIIILSGTLFQQLLKGLYHGYFVLQSINFDILTMARDISLHPNLLVLPLGKFFIAFTLFAISFFIMIYSYRIIKEKITNHGRTLASLLTYFFLYGLFITAVWIYIAFLFAAKKENKW